MRNLKTVNYDEMFTLSAPSPKWVWNAQGQLVEVPAGQPAFDHDPITGEPLGQRLEGEATNLLLNSFAPATQTVSVSDATTYTLSVYGSGSAEVTAGGSGTAMDGSPLTFTTTGTSVTVTVTGTLDVFQLEAGSAATSPIETTGSAVTRAADVATIQNVDTAEWFNADAFTLYAEVIPRDVENLAPAVVLGATAQDRVILFFQSGEAVAQVRGNQGITSISPAPEVNAGDRCRFAVSYRPGTAHISFNGFTQTVVNELDETPTKVAFGSLLNGTFRTSLTISDFRMMERALSAAELQELTS